VLVRCLETTVSPDAVAAASEWARKLCQEVGLSGEDSYRVELVVTELVQNVAQHSAPGHPEAPLELRAEVEGTELRLTVIDAGEPFDPLSLQPREQPETLEQAKLGGLGVALVREFADRCRYERLGDRNRFHATFAVQRETSVDPGQVRVARGSDRRRARARPRLPLRRADATWLEREARSGHDRRLTGFISRCELFRDVPYAQVEDIVASFPIKDVVGRAVLLRAGDRNDHVIFVLQGTLRVRFDTPDSPDCLEVTAGGCVGEMSVIDDKPVSAFVVADSGCRLLLVDAESFLSRIMTIPQVARNLVSSLSERMRRNTDFLIAQLKAKIELEQLQNDLRHARDIQASMLPRQPLFEGRSEVDCVGFMRAAREVGGDFYDAAFLDGNRLFVAVGDVCNKGLPAALYMVRALTTLRREMLQPSRNLRQHVELAVERLNQHLYESNEAQQFVTLFCGVVDLSARTLTYVNAGHNAALLAGSGTAFAYLSEPVNPIVGIVAGLRYEAAELAMPVGSTLVLYTDGITEAQDPAGEMFGDERLKALVQGLDRPSAGGLVNAILSAVDTFARGTRQADDITLLALRFVGSPNSADR
jgi:serine phosphatase RsbU (regulator of sigma subunit)/anti-sigma regulatory factor (Ser/Thr protein kinase)